MARIRFAPYALRVSATRHLAERLGGLCILPEGSRYVPRQTDVIVNWGRSNIPDWSNGALCLVLNDAPGVQRAVNKLESLRCFSERNVPTVEWATDVREVWNWLRTGATISDQVAGFARTSLTGRGGDGMVPFYHGTEYGAEGDVWPRAPLYTKYFKRSHEYRVHVMRGNVILVQRKKLLTSVRDAWQATHAGESPYTIRSYDRGWRFSTRAGNVPECVKTASVAAVAALGLDFGGVDVGYNERENRAAVFEVNSAPGIEGPSLDAYVTAFRRILE